MNAKVRSSDDDNDYHNDDDNDSALGAPVCLLPHETIDYCKTLNFAWGLFRDFCV